MFCRDDAPKWTTQMRIDYLQRGSDKKRLQHSLDSYGDLLCMRAIQSRSGGNKVDPSLQENVEIPYNGKEYIHHVGSSRDCNSVVHSGLIEKEDKRFLHSCGSDERTTRG